MSSSVDKEPQSNEMEVPRAFTRPIIIGIYGVSGSGKTTLIKQLETRVTQEFTFYDGSELITSVFPGTLHQFQNLDKDSQREQREIAIQSIKNRHIKNGKTAVIAGHCVLWNFSQGVTQSVWTAADAVTYTHIIYIDVPAEIIKDRCSSDVAKDRPKLSVDQLKDWQRDEKTALRSHCYDNGICLLNISAQRFESSNGFMTLLKHFRNDTEGHNLSRAESQLDQIFEGMEEVTTTLVFDADRTLSALDTGDKFWQVARDMGLVSYEQSPLDRIFRSQMGYSYAAFRQANLLYAETFSHEQFLEVCDRVATSTVMYREIIALLKRVVLRKDIAVLIITCGLRRVWKRILMNAGLQDRVNVIGGGRSISDLIVTPEVKAASVTRLRETHRQFVWAFGDSPIDIPMLKVANEAIVVVGAETTRSKTMDIALSKAIESGLVARQVLLPEDVTPRLDLSRLPVVDVNGEGLTDSIFGDHGREFIDATNKMATRLLMTPMRDTSIAGPLLREAHRRVGWYLATEYLTEIVGIETYSMEHVLGRKIDGYRLLRESCTLIVAMMRGGEPMASGVSDALPQAMFLHAKTPEQITPTHLEKQSTVILVDSVINNGDSMEGFMRHVSKLSPTVRIVLVTGVAQSQSIKRIRAIREDISNSKVSLIALRLSDTKFKGKGTTDTGNRLFNTTNLD